MLLYSDDEECVGVESLVPVVDDLSSTKTDDEEHVGVESLVSIVHDLWNTKNDDDDDE